MGAVGLEMGPTNGANKDGQSEFETGKGGGGNGGNGLGAVALWGCAAARIEFGAWDLGLGSWVLRLGAWGYWAMGPWGCGSLKWAKQMRQIKMDKVNSTLGKGLAEIATTGLGLWRCGAVRL